MKRYIDFVQKPKKGQPHTEGTATFISVPGKKPITSSTAKPVAKPAVSPVSQPLSVTKPVIKPTTRPVIARATITRTTTTTAISHPHYRPDFGPIRKKPLSQPATTTSVPKPMIGTVKRSTTTTIIARPATKPVVKPILKPSVKPLARSIPKPVENHVEKPVEKPAKKSVNPHKIEDFEEESVDSFDNLDSIFGVIEDYRPAKRPEAIKKRPLSTPKQRNGRQLSREIEEFDFEEEENAPEVELEENKAQPSKVDELLKAGKTPFIRTSTIEKRPLSNSVAKIKPVTTPKTPKDEPSDPATIIEKPEKDAHIGIIVTVVLTIVFGAAIGTAAFLLLPKS